MTAPRIARANRSRFFIGLGILILTMGFVAIFHNSQQQLDELRHMEMRCEQQQDALNSQIGIVENSLKSERLNHQQTKFELQKKTKDEKESREKFLVESNLKYSSLQQHYKLLKSQYEDLNDSCIKKDKQQSEEINGLQGKLKSIISENTQFIKEKDKEIEHLKVKLKTLENENSLLTKTQQAHGNADQQSIKNLQNANYNLEKQINLYRVHCSWRPNEKHNKKSVLTESPIELEKNFNSQISVSENLYKIPMKLVNHTNRMKDLSNIGVGNDRKPEGIINSVENFQIIPELVPENSLHKDVQIVSGKSSTAANEKLASEANNGIEQKLPNAPAPTATASNKNKTSSTTETIIKKNSDGNVIKSKSRPVPQGVVPPPENVNYMLNKNDDVSDHQNDRYSNVVNDIVAKRSFDKSGNNVNELENGAREVNDNNDFLMDERSHKDHLQDVLDDNKIVGNNINNNAAEEDTNIYDKHLNLIKPNENGKNSQKDEKILNSNKLLSEIDGDQGKVAAYPDDMHLEEQLEEEDDDEYSNPLARKQDPAVRN